MALRAVLIAAAGVASLAFLALRTKVPSTITRELDLASLELSPLEGLALRLD